TVSAPVGVYAAAKPARRARLGTDRPRARHDARAARDAAGHDDAARRGWTAADRRPAGHRSVDDPRPGIAPTCRPAPRAPPRPPPGAEPAEPGGNPPARGPGPPPAPPATPPPTTTPPGAAGPQPIAGPPVTAASTIHVPASLRRAALRHGLRLDVRCPAACVIH